MRSFFFISLLLGMFEINVSLIREYIYITEEKNWDDAQEYCRNYYTDLAIVTNNEENARLVASLKGADKYGFIRLYKTYEQGRYIWKWGDKESTFYRWFEGQPSNGSNENCVNAGPKGWNDQDCNWATFFCYTSWNMVLKKMTWQEAHQYCKHNFTNLAGPISGTHLDLLVNTLDTENQPVVVWSGVHFLDGIWYWLDGRRVENINTLSQCPANQYRCGALNLNSRTWENRDCNEALLFFCR